MKSNIIQKQSLISTVINYGGVVVAYLNLVFVLPYFLSVETIGLLRLVMEIATLLVLIFQIGAPFVVIRFYPFNNQSEFKEKSFYTFCLALGILGILLMIGFYQLFRVQILSYFSLKSDSIKHFEFEFLALASVLILFNVLERIFATKRIIIIPTFFKEIVNRLGITVIAIFIGLNIFPIKESVGFLVVIYCTLFMVLLYIYKRSFGLKPMFNREVWNISQLKSFFSYASLISIGSIGAGLSIKIDMIMTSSMLGLEEVALYSTMVYIATVIEIPKRALAQISEPFIAQYFAENDIKKIGTLYSKTSLLLTIMGLFVFFGIYYNLPYLFMIMPKGEYFSLGYTVFLIIAMVKISNLISSVAIQIILNSGEAWFTSSSIFTLAIVSIALNYYLIPIYGIEGAALATLISVGTFNLVVVIFVFYKFRIHPLQKNAILLLFTSILAFILYSQIPLLSNPFLGMVLTTSIIGVSFPLIIWKSNISPDANQMALSLYTKAKSFLKI